MSQTHTRLPTHSKAFGIRAPTLWGLCMAVTMAVAGAVDAHTTSALGQPSQTRAPGRPMSQDEVRNLYAGKTWMWAGGAGYLAPDGSFSAYVGRSGPKATYAKGTWRVGEDGKLCFQATWYIRDGSNEAVTCFGHRKRGATIEQRKEPAGRWYVFRHSPARTTDEFRKLRPGDRVTAQVARLETSFPKPQ